MVAVLSIPNSTITGIPAQQVSDLVVGVTAGPLLLWEPGNTIAPYTGVPVSGLIPDLARTLATTTIGADPGDLAVTSSINNTGAKTKIERTAKGGVHIMASQLNQDTSYELWRLGLGSARLGYVNANAGHSYYLGAWFRKTRQFGSGTLAAQPFGLQKGSPDSTAADRWLTAGPNSTGSHITTGPVSGDSRLINLTTVDDGSNGLLIFVGISTNATPASWTAALDQFVSVGAKSSGQANKYPSLVLYRAYLEDLTVSGRTGSTVAGIDRAEFVAQCQTSGGRYYGDTWSDPATVLP